MNYPNFSPSSPLVPEEKRITQLHCCYLLRCNSQKRKNHDSHSQTTEQDDPNTVYYSIAYFQNNTKLFFYRNFVWVMTHSHAHLSTPVIDDQSLFRNRRTARCECREILIQHSFNVLFLTNFCQLSLHSLSAAVSQIEEGLTKLVISLKNWSESSFFPWKMTWFSRHF